MQERGKVDQGGNRALRLFREQLEESLRTSSAGTKRHVSGQAGSPPETVTLTGVVPSDRAQFRDTAVTDAEGKTCACRRTSHADCYAKSHYYFSANMSIGPRTERAKGAGGVEGAAGAGGFAPAALLQTLASSSSTAHNREGKIARPDGCQSKPIFSRAGEANG